MGEEGQHMDDSLYRAAQLQGANIPGPAEVNFHSRTMGDRNNALHVAAQYNNHEFIKGVVDQLGQYRYQLLCQQNSKGETPLHLAAQLGHVETVRVLVRAHDDVKGAAGPFYSPGRPCWSERDERVETVRVLVRAHDDLEGAAGPFYSPRRPCWSERDERGDTPLHKALRNEREDIAMLLLDKDIQLVSVDNNVGESLAYLAADNFCNKFLLKILDLYHCHQCSVSFSGPFGQTVFHSARRLTEELMWKLIDIWGGPHLKTQDKEGKTVVHYAVEEDRRPMVVALLRADNSLAYLHDNDGLTPLHIAFKKGLSSMVRIILEMSPQSIEILDKEGKPAFHNAKMNTGFLVNCTRTIDTKILNLLINQVDKDGNTPLHVALNNSEEDAAFQLLGYSGCNWRLRNNEGYNPLDLCKSNDKISIASRVHILLSDLEGVQQILRRREWIRYRVSSLIRVICNVTLEGIEEEELEKWLNKIAVAAALMLPLNFASSFNVPGGYDINTGQPILRKNVLFDLFMISNMTAFSANVSILFLCTFGVGKRVSKKKLARESIRLIQVALTATIMAYFFGFIGIGGKTGRGFIYVAIPMFILFVSEIYILSQVLVAKWFN